MKEEPALSEHDHDHDRRFTLRALLRRVSRFARMAALGALASVAHAQSAADAPAGPSVALYYGANPPVEELAAFDVVVVDPDAHFDPRAHAKAHQAWFAYVSVGEVNPHRAYYSAMPSAWLPGVNEAWASHVIDQTAAEWPTFFVDKVIAPLWKKGYRGFFLDTLDSYHLIAKTDAARAAQEAGLVRVIRAIKKRYPKAKLIFNRGFEVLPQIHDLAYMVAFESLYRGWDAGKQRYTEVPQADRDWLLMQAATIRDQYKLPVLSIDYCPPADDTCATATAARITQAGFVPYVTDGGLATVGVGAAGTRNERP
ncbi:endo alpha-1,4 polygalactosaminidase [Paraburkholderia sp. NPDC080076]|uniref:endo alpha-1,4 polygalactosaminidase n=1 Tax=Paraburkholderia sp. NPDC080076 TaxID=3390605 RepID=UPI003D07AC93